MDALYQFHRHVTELNVGRNNVGVYCRNGANRSAQFMAGYIMARCGVSADDAMQYLWQRRHVVDFSNWDARDGGLGQINLWMERTYMYTYIEIHIRIQQHRYIYAYDSIDEIHIRIQQHFLHTYIEIHIRIQQHTN